MCSTTTGTLSTVDTFTSSRPQWQHASPSTAAINILMFFLNCNFLQKFAIPQVPHTDMLVRSSRVDVVACGCHAEHGELMGFMLRTHAEWCPQVNDTHMFVLTGRYQHVRQAQVEAQHCRLVLLPTRKLL